MRTGELLLLLCFTFAHCQSAIGQRANMDERRALPFLPQEQLVYEGEFSKLILRNINIAEFRFAARFDDAPPPAINTRGAANPPSKCQRAPGLLSLTGEARADGWFHKLFGINFRYRIESKVDPESFAVLETRRYDEQGSRVRVDCAVFDRQRDQVTWIEKDPKHPAQRPNTITSQIGDALYDILSAIYVLRTKPLAPGAQFEMIISDAGHPYRVPVKVAETKRLKTILGEVETVRLEVGIFGENGLVRRDGRMSLWMTTDSKRIPVRAELSSDLGTLSIKLKRISYDPQAVAAEAQGSPVECMGAESDSAARLKD
ncbi:MAG: DUF3108 domain-containing protein [Pyrinomonas methylaliphatogenes]|nr:DUF3108 domain-containing protein [Pyrinomonas methylaliphatogenes]